MIQKLPTWHLLLDENLITDFEYLLATRFMPAGSRQNSDGSKIFYFDASKHTQDEIIQIVDDAKDLFRTRQES